MSSAIAEVYTPTGELVGYSVYHGTSDVQLPFIEAEPEWGKGYEGNGWDKQRDCEHGTEPCFVFSSYGYGDYWPAEMCRICMVLQGRTVTPSEPDYGWGTRDPDAEVFWEQWCKEWPKRGHPFPESGSGYAAEAERDRIAQERFAAEREARDKARKLGLIVPPS
jgi:hypothetical protein